MSELKKPIEEYINLSIMNLTKAIEKLNGTLEVVQESINNLAEKEKK